MFYPIYYLKKPFQVVIIIISHVSDMITEVWSFYLIQGAGLEPRSFWSQGLICTKNLFSENFTDILQIREIPQGAKSKILDYKAQRGWKETVLSLASV